MGSDANRGARFCLEQRGSRQVVRVCMRLENVRYPETKLGGSVEYLFRRTRVDRPVGRIIIEDRVDNGCLSRRRIPDEISDRIRLVVEEPANFRLCTHLAIA